jgi:two-component system KDP operon response regulator KdpE
MLLANSHIVVIWSMIMDTAPLILLVDDELAIRRFLRASLADTGYRVNEAETGEQAIRLAGQQPPDLVVLDLGLPDMDGQEVLKQLREWLHAPILVLSARDQEGRCLCAAAASVRRAAG